MGNEKKQQKKFIYEENKMFYVRNKEDWDEPDDPEEDPEYWEDEYEGILHDDEC